MHYITKIEEGRMTERLQIDGRILEKALAE
jgi:hypothetical protein